MSDSVSRVFSRERTPEAGTAHVNGVNIAYRLWSGPPVARRAPVVLLHGLLQSGAGMANLAAHLSRRGPVLAPDLRGRGESEQPGAGYDPATMAADVAELMERLAIDLPVVIGRMHGGVVAYHLAARLGEGVRGLVLGDAPPELSAERSERSRLSINKLPREFSSMEAAVDFYETALGLSRARALHDIPSDLIALENGSLMWRHNLDVIAEIDAASAPRDDWQTVMSITCPVLFLRGQRGGTSKEIAQKLTTSIGNCQVQTVIGAQGDVFLGPGAEQTFGAIEVFLQRLSNHAATSQLPLPGDAVLAGAHGPEEQRGVIERLAAALNARDDSVIRDLYAPDGQFVLHLPDGAVQTGDAELAREAFWTLLTTFPGSVVSARQQLATGDRAAAILTIHEPDDPHPQFMVPVFVQLQEGRIVRLTAFAERILV